MMPPPPPPPPPPRRRVWDCLPESDDDVEANSAESSRPTCIETECSSGSSGRPGTAVVPTTKADQDTSNNTAATTRRRIWDDYDVGQDDVDANIADENNPLAPTPTSCSSAAATSIHARIVEMKKTLSSKSKQLRQLKCDLVQAKLSNRQRLQELQSSLHERRREQRTQHSEAMASQNQLLSTIRNDCANMNERAEVISGEIRQAAESKQRLCRTLEIGGRRELQRKQREWEMTERRRLAKLLTERTESMKQDAAKSLEPELSRILKKNKKEKQVLREQLTKETADLRSRLEAENEVRAQEEMEAIRKEMEAKGRQLEEQLQQRLAQISLKHSDEMERIRGVSTGQLYGDATLEAALTRREDEHIKALEAIRTQEVRDASAVTERHQRAMADLREYHRETLEVERSRFHSSLDEWRVQRGQQLEEESKALEREEISKIRRKTDDEITRVAFKLSEEAKEKKKDLQVESDNLMSNVEDSLMLEMRSARRENDAAESQARDAKEERTILSKAVDEDESRISKAKLELADVEKASAEAKMNAEKMEAQANRNMESVRETAKTAIDEAKMELSSLESSLHTIQEKEKENAGHRNKAEKDQKAQYTVEVDSVRTRIADLMKRKEAKVEAASALLQTKTDQSKSLEKSIEEARKL